MSVFSFILDYFKKWEIDIQDCDIYIGGRIYVNDTIKDIVMSKKAHVAIITDNSFGRDFRYKATIVEKQWSFPCTGRAKLVFRSKKDMLKYKLIL